MGLVDYSYYKTNTEGKSIKGSGAKVWPLSTAPLLRIHWLISGLLCVGLVLCLLVAVGCTAPAPTLSETPVPTPAPEPKTQSQASENPEPKVLSKEESQKIAADFLQSSPTFRFDGMKNTLKLVWSGAEEKLYRWEFHYEFQSRHAGYGDRTGLILAQVITDHRAQIVVEQGEVVHAVLDGKWDMLRQKIK